MNKVKNFAIFTVFFLIIGCSFDKKTGIWSGSEKEKKRISELQKEQSQIIDISKIYSSENIFSKEIFLRENIQLTTPNRNSSWKMSSLNNQNFLGNIYFSGLDNVFLKKKIGKDKFKILKRSSSPLLFEGSIIISDDNGSIFNVNQIGQIKWKKNIYKKIYKKINKNLFLSIYKNNLYVADNIGFIYAVQLDTGKLLWIKNHGIPLKSNIKIFKNKIFIINQDNRIICLNVKNGAKIWDIRSISSFIKSQNPLSIAVSKHGDLVIINSSGDLIKINSENGDIYWSLNTSGSMYAHATDFFISSDVVIDNEEIIFSAQSSIFSYNLNNAYINWEQEVDSVSTPIIDKKNIFIVSNNGFFVILNKNTGKIIHSINILQVLKKKKQNTKIAGFIMGSGKIYSVTLNGYIIISSAISGKVEGYKKIGDPINSFPIINDGKLYILTEKSRLFVFN